MTASTTDAGAIPEQLPDPMDNMGFRCLLVGAVGTGKTYALRSLLDCGLTPMIISTEPGIRATLGDLDETKIHWKYVAPANMGWDVMLSNADKIHKLSFESLAKGGPIDKKHYGQFLEVVSSCASFTCDRTGENFGMVDTWGTDRVLVIDSLSGLSKMAMNLVIGAKPVKAVGEWGVAMDNLERLIDRWTTGIPCHFIMTAHLEREKDEISGAIKNMPSTLGQKLAPKIPLYFDDVIMCKRKGDKWTWSTADANTDLKSRHLKVAEGIVPGFKQVFEAWKKNGGTVTETQS